MREATKSARYRGYVTGRSDTTGEHEIYYCAPGADPVLILTPSRWTSHGEQMAWGYRGSGPAAAAYNILCDYLGLQPNDVEVRSGRCEVSAIYQKFKEAFLAPAAAGEDLVIETTAIEAWLALPEIVAARAAHRKLWTIEDEDDAPGTPGELQGSFSLDIPHTATWYDADRGRTATVTVRQYMAGWGWALDFHAEPGRAAVTISYARLRGTEVEAWGDALIAWRDYRPAPVAPPPTLEAAVIWFDGEHYRAATLRDLLADAFTARSYVSAALAGDAAATDLEARLRAARQIP